MHITLMLASMRGHEELDTQGELFNRPTRKIISKRRRRNNQRLKKRRRRSNLKRCMISHTAKSMAKITIKKNIFMTKGTIRQNNLQLTKSLNTDKSSQNIKNKRVRLRREPDLTLKTSLLSRRKSRSRF